MHWIDPDHLPESSGMVECFLLNGEGEADGFLFKDGLEIHFPPHMGSRVLAAVRPGTTVHVRGVRPRAVAMVAAVSVTPEDGARIVDSGPPDDEDARKVQRKQPHARRTDLEAQGVIRQLLHGPKGEVRGVMLEDGRAGRFPAQAAPNLAQLLVTNASILFRGEGLVTAHGTVIVVDEIGTCPDDLCKVEVRKPKNKHKDHVSQRPGPRDGRPDAAPPV